MNNEITVSVICTAYNHEKYIRKCLDGFIMQKTNYKFEVLVHDDASTDKTPEIIREYQNKYPDIIKPIYQTVNCYSQGIDIIKDIIFPNVNGKFVALCEGDDCWVDPLKLQEQYDLLNENETIHACYHNVQHISEKGELLNTYFPKSRINSGMLTSKMLLTNYFHLCSLFIRTSDFNSLIHERFAKLSLATDGIMLRFLANLGYVYYIDKVMSYYRENSINSWTERIRNDSEYKLQCIRKEIESLEAYNEYTNKFLKIINEKILGRQILIYCITGDPNIIYNSKYKKSFFQLTFHFKLLFISAFFPNIKKFYSTIKRRFSTKK